MSVYVLSPDALQDLQDIWDFVALDNEMPPTNWKISSLVHSRS
jgi:plasmid stabilization system protein ParE